MQPESSPPASTRTIAATNLMRMFSILNNHADSHTPEEADTGSPPTFDVSPNGDAAPTVRALAHAPLDGVPSSAGRTHRHPSRLAERRETARQVGLTRNEPWLEPPFRLPANEELQSQPSCYAWRYLKTEDGSALRQLLVHEVAELSYLQGCRCREPALLSDLGDQGVADHDLRYPLCEFKAVVPHPVCRFLIGGKRLVRAVEHADGDQHARAAIEKLIAFESWYLSHRGHEVVPHGPGEGVAIPIGNPPRRSAPFGQVQLAPDVLAFGSGESRGWGFP
jgi:hypothetical protein